MSGLVTIDSEVIGIALLHLWLRLLFMVGQFITFMVEFYCIYVVGFITFVVKSYYIYGYLHLWFWVTLRWTSIQSRGV